jgi:hypothetical protein
MSSSTGDVNDGWERTLATATEMEADLAADGWSVVTVRAVHTAPVPPSHGATDRFGYVYTAPGDVASAFTDAVASGTFDEYEVFSRRVGDVLFCLTRVTDVDRAIAVLLVGAIDLSQARALMQTVHERGELYSHVERLDGTLLGSFHHPDPEPLLPGGR